MSDESSVSSARGTAAGLSLDASVYRLVAVQKAAYRLADQCTAEIVAAADGRSWHVRLMPAGESAKARAEELERRFLRELLDQELREKVADETRDLRALILAHAFSRTDLVR